MNFRKNASATNIWQLQKNSAQLQIASFSACVDLSMPALGLQQISFENRKITGQLLGVALNKISTGHKISASNIFTRGNDLAATYVETNQQPYSLEVYWHVTSGDSAIVIDLLLSLETLQLESFPGVSTQSQLSAVEAWLIPFSGSPATEVIDSAGVDLVPEPCGIMLRPADASWSYVEMHHPDDLGKVKISKSAKDQLSIQRDLAGTFMEKGVIRRLRVRGGFVPRESDFLIARQLFNDLAVETPPLTA